MCKPDARLIARRRRQVAQRGVLAQPFDPRLDRGVDILQDVLGGPHQHLGMVAIDHDGIAWLDARQHVGRTADNRNIQGTRHDRDVAERRALLEHHAAQARAVVVEQLGRPHVASDDDHVLGQAAGIDGDTAGQAQQQAIGEILQVAQPLTDVGVGRLAEPRAHVVEGALHAGFAGETRGDRLAHPLDPAAIVGEHAEGLEDLALLARLHVVGFEQAVDIVPHATQRLLEARMFRRPRPRRRRAG